MGEVGFWQFDVEVSLIGDFLITEVATVTVIINPCQVTELNGKILQTPTIDYPLRTPALEGASYSFVQARECGYDIVIETIGLP